MASKAGSIVINIRAGTTNLQSDLDKGKRAFKEFGGHAVSQVQATSGALRVLEGGLTNNLRAAERFAANVLGLGPILQKAFPVIGALAFSGLLLEMGSKVVDFFKKVQEGPEKVRGAFGDLNASLHVTNDSLLTANDRLRNDIAQLEGKPVNNLKVAMDEAREAADKLNESVLKTMGSAFKLITDNPGSGGFFEQLWTRAAGSAPTKDIPELIGGKTGVGGGHERLRGLSGDALSSALASEIQRAAPLLAEAQKQQQDYAQIAGLGWSGGALAGALVGDQSGRLELLRGYIAGLKELQQTVKQTGENSGLNIDRAKKQDAAEAFGLGKPFTDKLAELDAQLDGVKNKLNAVGLNGSAKILAEGYEAADKAIQEVNKALEKRHTSLTSDQEDEIRQKEVTLALADAELKWQDAFAKSSAMLQEHTSTLRALTAAGGDYAQKRDARIQEQLANTLGRENYNDPNWILAHSDQVDSARTAVSKNVDAEQAYATGNALKQLAEKLRLTQAMTAAEKDGAIAVQAAELAERRRDRRGKSRR